MKQITKRIKTISLITLLFILLGSIEAKAQKISLRVGDPAPPITAFKWIKGEPVTELEKGKVHVVEFGATWCEPCIAMIPQLTAMMRKYRDKVKVISFFIMEVNNEPLDTPNPKYVEKVEKYVADKSNRMKYTIAVDDPQKTMEKTWHKAAGRTGIPVTFVIDKEGKIAWIGNMPKARGVVKAIIDGSYSLEEMIRIAREEEAMITPYDAAQPLLIAGNGGADSLFMFRSLLAKFKGDIKTGGSHFIVGNRNMVQEIGFPLSKLYMLAYGDTSLPFPMSAVNSYGKYWRDPVLEVKDTIPFQFSYRAPENRWNYSLILPEKANAKILEEMIKGLKEVGLILEKGKREMKVVVIRDPN